MKTLLALALMLLSAVAQAEQLATDPAYGVRYSVASLKLEMPEDYSKTYVTVFGHGPKFEQVKQWFVTNDQLANLAAQSHYTAIDTASELFRDNYAASTPGKLTIRFQNPDGTVIHEVADGQIGLSAESLIRQTNSAQCFRRRSQPDPYTPPPIIDQPDQPIAPPPKPRFPWLLLALVTCLGGASGVGYQWYKTHK